MPEPGIPFFKMSGCGNDFIALAEPAAWPDAARVRAWCRRGLSLGADGVLALRRAEGDVVELRYWNSDGGEAALCLNGTRCAAGLALALGWRRDRLTIRTGAGDLQARRLETGLLAVAAPLPEALRRLTLRTEEGDFDGFLVTVGVPHFVCLRAEPIGDLPLARWGPPLRRHRDLGPEGANVDLVEAPARDRLAVRSFERGVEGETLACGTGVLAAAAAALAAGVADLPLTADTRGGFPLAVLGAARAGRVERWELAGEARLVARGELLEGAAALPPAQGGLAPGGG